MSNSDSRPALTAQRLREKLHYNPETGLFTIAPGFRSAGKVTGTIRRDGYVQISVDDKCYFGHRLAWLHVNGAWPTTGLDHRNRNRQDNRIANLREASAALNNLNFGDKPQARNKLGVLGVYLMDGKYAAQIGRNGKTYLGRFDTIEEASAAYQAARAERDAAITAREVAKMPSE